MTAPDNDDPFVSHTRPGAVRPFLTVVVCLALVAGAGLVLVNQMRRLAVQNEMQRIFWDIEDTRAGAQNLFDTAYYKPEKERKITVRRLRLLLAELDNTRNELADFQTRARLHDNDRILKLHAMYIDVRNLIELYIVTVGPREKSDLFEIKRHEAEVLQEYVRTRNTIAGALGIPDEKQVREEMERQYFERRRN